MYFLLSILLYSFTFDRVVRVLSLRSSVIHGFVTEPWYSHHVRVFMWARGFECAWVARSLVCVHCFVWSMVFGSRHSCLEFRFVSGFGHSHSIFCHCVSVRSRVRSTPHTLVHVCFVVLHAVRVSIGCMHLCYILCCVARSLDIHWLRAFVLSCLVWTRGLWVFSLAACSCPVLHMAGVGRPVSTVNHNVIQVGCCILLMGSMELVHHSLEGWRCPMDPKR